MESWIAKARAIAEETAKRSHELARETAKYSEQLAAEAARRSKEFAEEAAKKADGSFKELVVEAVRLREVVAAQAAGVGMGMGVGVGGGGGGAGGRGGERKAEELEEYGVTEELREFVKGLTLKTFKEFPMEEVNNMTGVKAPAEPKPSDGPVAKDLSEFQEHHARIILEVVPEVSDFRYLLCPRRMTEKKFWKIYFLLVNSHLAPYEAKATEKAAQKTEIEMASASESAKTFEESKSAEAKKANVTPLKVAAMPAGEGKKVEGKGKANDQDLDDYLMGALEGETAGEDDDEGDFDPDDFEQLVNQTGNLDSPYSEDGGRTRTAASGGQPQYLDKLQVERERGITVKAQTATMTYNYNPAPSCHTTPSPTSSLSSLNPNPNSGSETPSLLRGKYLLNLIDTPGHVDFSYEVSRSLAATQGVLLVVDASQGIQAQTVANFYLAFEANLAIVPIINKIDQPNADPSRVKAQLKAAFDIDPDDCLLTSAKTGVGLEKVLPAVIERIGPPLGQEKKPLRALLLDSHYDEYRGVICHVTVVDGALRKGEKISSAASGQSYEILEVGIMNPELTPTGMLLTGQVGYIVTGMRSTREARVGDTWHHCKVAVTPLPGFRPAKPMVFAGIFPADGAEYEVLCAAVDKLTCNDASVAVSKETSGALGVGFRCGFLGVLHMEVFHQRLEQEYGTHVITTAPTVPYIFEYADGTTLHVQNPAALPANPGQRVTASYEPIVNATIITPKEYVGAIMTLCSDRRGEQKEYSFLDEQRALLKYCLPLREVVTDFYNELKSLTSGYASFDYEDAGYRSADLVRVDVLLNGRPVDALAAIAHRSRAQGLGRNLVDRLRTTIDRQMFDVVIQAAIGGKVIARETLSALRKNVLAKCYGGDVSRKRKLLEKQKEGKRRMKRVGEVEVPQEAFHQLLKTG